MSTVASIDSFLRQQFDLEWQNLARLVEHDEHGARLVHQLGPINWFIDNLLDLLTEFHNRPASDLGPVIRRILVEQDFIDENGDSVVDQKMLDVLDHQVDLIVDVLERVRSRCLTTGHWSETPMAPQMFG